VPEQARASVRVSGQVQGVGFRFAVQRRASSLDLAGWVRNEPDGAVAAVFEGPRNLVESMVDWCRHGPHGAEVAAFEVAWEAPEDARGFAIR
jgi:acylphosphatase